MRITTTLKVFPRLLQPLHLHSLVYRRVVSKFLPAEAARPWMRNAAVAMVITPGIALAAIITVTAGSSIIGSILIVVGQVLTYLLLYARLVRCRWGAARPARTVHAPTALPANAPALTIVESGDYALHQKKRA